MCPFLSATPTRTHYYTQYDQDVTVWSPAGRLHQVEYAMEAVKHGSACAGLRSDTHTVLVALKRSPNELSSYQQKVFKIDQHIGISVSGLTADGRILSRYMRKECIQHKFTYDSPLIVGRLVLDIADKSQECTQRSWKRPYGVGLLVAGYDKGSGPKLFQTCPSGNYYEFYAMAIGSRSQAAKTYLEKTYTSFPSCSVKELCLHGIRAIKETCPNDTELSTENCVVAYVGKDTPFTFVDGELLGSYLSEVEAEDGGNGGGGGDGGGEAAAAATSGGEAMDTDAAGAGSGGGDTGATGDAADPMDT